MGCAVVVGRGGDGSSASKLVIAMDLNSSWVSRSATLASSGWVAVREHEAEGVTKRWSERDRMQLSTGVSQPWMEGERVEAKSDEERGRGVREGREAWCGCGCEEANRLREDMMERTRRIRLIVVAIVRQTQL